MRKSSAIVFANLCVIGSIFSSTAAFAIGGSQAQIQNYETPGNLESKHDLDCISLDAAKPAYNPVDLYKGVARCVAAKRFDDGVVLFMLAGVYGRYDMERVADGTAHQAVTVARMTYLGEVSAADSKQFSDAAARLMANKELHKQVCTTIRLIGPPSYYPRYMVQHGMGAFMGGSGNGLVDNFDSKAAFENAMKSYLHCEPS